MDLEAKKRELLDMQEELDNLKNRYFREQDNTTLERKIDSLNSDIKKLSGEVDILEKIELLEKKYSNGEPIIFHYTDNDGLSDDIELSLGDVNYNRAYQQQRDLLQLEYDYYNKLPLSYVIRNNKGLVEGVCNSDNYKYDDIYNYKKKELLNRDIIYNVKSDKKQDEVQATSTETEDVKNDIKYSGKHFKKESNDKVDETYVDPGYRLLNSNGQIIVVGDIPLEKKDAVLKNIVKDFGQSAVDNMKVFDTKTLTKILNKEKMYRLSDSDYYADMDEYGNIGILNNDKVIYVIEKNRSIEGKSLISKEIDKKNEKKSNIHIGKGKHFKPNNLDSEYAVFKKDGYLHLIGNFTEDFVRNNCATIFGDLINDKNAKGIKVWNELSEGTNSLDGFDIFVDVKDGAIKVSGDVEDLNYHNKLDEKEITNKKEGKHFKDNNDNKDMSGLDVIPDELTLDDLSNGAVNMQPVKGKKVKSREKKPSLLAKAKEKFSGLKKWQKVAIIAGVIAVAGVGVFVVGPQIINTINNFVNSENVNEVNQVVQTISGSPISDTVSQATQSVDYSSMGGAGHTVFTNAADAVNNANGLVSNEWFSNNPVDVFNTATNSYMGLTPEQLNDPNLLAELAKDPNNAMLFGDSISDASGFVSLDDIVNQVTKTR